MKTYTLNPSYLPDPAELTTIMLSKKDRRSLDSAAEYAFRTVKNVIGREIKRCPVEVIETVDEFGGSYNVNDGVLLCWGVFNKEDLCSHSLSRAFERDVPFELLAGDFPSVIDFQALLIHEIAHHHFEKALYPAIKECLDTAGVGKNDLRLGMLNEAFAFSVQHEATGRPLASEVYKKYEVPELLRDLYWHLRSFRSRDDPHDALLSLLASDGTEVLGMIDYGRRRRDGASLGSSAAAGLEEKGRWVRP